MWILTALLGEKPFMGKKNTCFPDSGTFVSLGRRQKSYAQA